MDEELETADEELDGTSELEVVEESRELEDVEGVWELEVGEVVVVVVVVVGTGTATLDEVVENIDEELPPDGHVYPFNHWG